MAEFIVRRLLAAVPVLFLVSLIAASIMQLVPGDPAVMIAGQSASDAEIARVRESLGLDRPFIERLWDWYVGLAHGDLGHSLLLNRPVTQAIAERVPVTLALAGFGLFLTIALGVPCGVIAALRPNTWIDQAVLTFALLGVSLPNFWLGLMLIVLFARDARLAAGGRLRAVRRRSGRLGALPDSARDCRSRCCRSACSRASRARPCSKCCARTMCAPRAPRACRRAW